MNYRGPPGYRPLDVPPGGWLLTSRRPDPREWPENATTEKPSVGCPLDATCTGVRRLSRRPVAPGVVLDVTSTASGSRSAAMSGRQRQSDIPGAAPPLTRCNVLRRYATECDALHKPRRIPSLEMGLRTNRGHLIVCDNGHPHAIGLPSSHGESLTLPVSGEPELRHRARDSTADSASAVHARQRA
jgi:hypothetical protein